MYEIWISFLSKNKLFEEISEVELLAMLNCLKPVIRDYSKDELVALEGDKLSHIGIILQGTAKVLKENSEGNSVIISLLKPQDMYGEIAAFSQKRVFPSSVYAQENIKVMLLEPGKLVGTCEKSCTFHKNLIFNLLKIISTKALMLNRKVEYLSKRTLRGKLKAFLLEEERKNGDSFTLPMNRDELADFLNVTRPSLSRELCAMRDEGIIEFSKSKVKILDKEALIQLE